MLEMVTSERFREPADPDSVDPPEDVPYIGGFPPQDHPQYPRTAGPEARIFFEAIYYGMIEEMWLIINEDPAPVGYEAIWQEMILSAAGVVDRAVESMAAPVRTAYDLGADDRDISDQRDWSAGPWCLHDAARCSLRRYGIDMALFKFGPVYSALLQRW